MKIFIDTEFTNFINPRLISIGLVAETGEEAYFETEYSTRECSDFVREVVIPLLGREPNASAPRSHLAQLLTTWLSLVRPRAGQEVAICFDYQTDWNLLVDALEHRVPQWIKPRNVTYEVGELLYRDFFEKSGLPEHHALYDARANAYAFREKPVRP
jgi:hypothetical protein